MKTGFKRSIAILLSLMMTLSMMPSMVFAVGEQAAANVESTQEAVNEVRAEQPAEIATNDATEPEAEEPADETADKSQIAETETNDESADEAGSDAAELSEEPEEATPEEETKEETDPDKKFSYRLLVGFSGSIDTREDDVLLGTFGNTVLLGFDSAKELSEAKSHYENIAAFASVDGVLNASAESSAQTNVDTANASAKAEPASINDNPLASASEEGAAKVSGKTIALVDTGAGGSNVATSLSVLGDSGSDDNGHGTDLAAVIAAENPDAKLISIKALGADGKGSVASVYAGIMLASESGADVIALPFSAKGSSDAIDSAISSAADKGAQVLAAAGNDSDDAANYCPANASSSTAVGALNEEGEPADFSNTGATVKAWAKADSTSEATVKVAAGIAGDKTLSDYALDITAEETAKTDEEAKEFETAYKTTTDDLVDGGVYIIRLRKEPKKAMVPSSGNYSDGNKFVLSAADKPEDIDAQFKLQKVNYNFYLKSRRDTNYIMSPEGGANNLGQNGQKVHQWKKSSSNYKDFDQWYMQRNGNYYRISNGANTGMHLQTEGSNTAAYTTIHLWNATSGTQGDWIFERVYYTVRFNPNGGSGSAYTQKYWQEENKALTANKFTRTGYTFKRWRDGLSPTNYYSNQQKVQTLTTKNAETWNLWAEWTANTYYVAYNGNGSTSGSMSNSTHTYDTAKNLTGNAYSRTGYAFNGWNTKADGSGTSYANSASVKNLNSTNKGTTTLYAQWKGNSYTVKYHGNGSTSGSTADSSHTYGTAKDLTANGFTRTGYTFAGWNTKADGTGTNYTDKQSVNNLTSTNNGTFNLYAQWTPNTYTVSMDAKGGKLAGSGISTSTDESATATAKYDEAFSVHHPVREGYEFTGWSVSGMEKGITHEIGSSTSTTETASNVKDIHFKNLRATSGTVKFEANWNPNTYTVRFDADGGTLAPGTANPYTATYDQEFSANAPARPGYVFTGWQLTGMEGTSHIIGGETVKENSYTYNVDESTDSVTFKNLRSIKGEAEVVAVWADDKYTVKYDLAGGTHSDVKTGDENPYEYNTTFHLANPSRAGYKFTGWTVAGMDENSSHIVGGEEVTAGTVTAVTGVTFGKLSTTGGPVTMTATWKAENVTVALISSEGSEADYNQQINYTFEESADYYYDAEHRNKVNDNKVEMLPERSHYKFTGYYESTDGTGDALIAADGTISGELYKKYPTATNLYAGWEPEVYTVTLSQDDATTKGTEAVYEKYGEGIYNDAEASSETDAIDIPERKVEVTFDVGTEDIEAPENAQVDTPFTGFYDSEDTALIGAGGQLLTAFTTTKFEDNASLTAKWDAGSVTLPAPSERDGYTFDGWYTKETGGDKAGDAGDSYSVKEDTTLYAKWKADPVLKYDKNAADATGTMEDDSAAKGKKLTPAECGYTRLGYTFMGWNTRDDGSGTSYAAGKQVTWNEDLPLSGEYTLYAQWSKNELKEISKIADQQYTGSAIEPNVVVRNVAGDKVEASEYTLSWENNTKVGTATVTATPKAGGSYAAADAVSTTFNITKADASEFAVVKTNYAAVYDGKEHVVKAESKIQDEGHSYKIGYGENEVEARAMANAQRQSSTSNEGFKVKNVSDSGIVCYYIIADNYEDVSGTLNVSITKKEITVSGITATSRPYDGTTDVTIDDSNAQLDGVCEGDTLSLDKSGASAVASSKNAGTQKVTVTGLGISGTDKVLANYTFTQPSDVTVEITKKPVTLEWTAGNYTYDGNAKSYTGASIKEGVVGSEDVQVGTYSGNVKTNAGDYTAKVESLTGDDSANYIVDSTTASNAWTIAKATNSITVTMDDWTFGDTPKEPVLSGVTYGAEKVQYTYYLYEDCEDWCKTEPSDDGSTTVGGKPTYANYSYWVKATIPGNENYETVSAKDEFRIEQAEVRVRPNEASSVRGQEPLSGEEIGYQIIGDMLPGDKEKLASLIEFKLDDSFNKDVADVYTTKSGWKEDDDYDYEIYDYIDKNYDVRFDYGVYTVTRSDAKVKASDYYGVYDGKPHSAEVSVEGDDRAVIYYLDPNSYDEDLMTKLGYVKQIYNTDDEEEFRKAYDEAEAALEASPYASITKPTRTDAGVTTQFRFYVLTDQSIPDIIEGYGFIEITPAPLTVTAKDKTITYGDGAANDGVTYEGFVNGETEATALDTSGLSYDYSGYAAGSDAGKYNITPSGITANNGNYEITYKPGTLTVEPKVVELDWSADQFNYNGTERIVTASVNNKVGSDDVSVASYTDNARTAAGEYQAKATVLTGAKAGNYTLTGSTTATHNWTIKEMNNDVSVSMTGWTYGDAANEPVVTTAADNLDVDKAKVEYFKDADCKEKTGTSDGASAEGGRPSNAGTYYVKASLEQTDAYEGSEDIKEFTIARKAITITPDNKVSQYKNPLKALTYQLSADMVGSDDLEITLSTVATTGSEAGDYDIVVAYKENSNYVVTANNGTYTITKAPMSASISGYDATYDGESHGVSVTLDPTEEGKATVYYSTTELDENNYTSGTTNPKDDSVTQKDAGEKTVYYYVFSKHYESAPVKGSATVKVSKAPLTVTAEDKTATYGDETPAGSVRYEGFVNGESESDLDVSRLKYDFGGYAAGNNAGTYDIKASGIKSENYDITYAAGTLTVDRLPVKFTWAEASYEYNGSAQGPEATVSNKVGPDDVVAEGYTGNTNVNTGSYTAQVTSIGGADAGNYVFAANEKTTSFKWKIIKGENVWNAEPAISDWTYGKTASTPTSTAKYDADKVVYEYKKAGLSGLLDTYSKNVPTEAGSYKMRATVPGTDNYDELKTEVEFKILPAEITISADDKSSEYRDTLVELTYKVGGDYVDGDELGVVLDSTVNKLSPVGEYPITVNWAQNPNYTATLNNGTYTITSGHLELTASDTTAEYDGQPHGISVTINKPELHDATIWYSTSEITAENLNTVEKTEDPLDDSVAQTDVGSKTVYYYVSSENFVKGDSGDDIKGSRTVTVNKADLTVATNRQTITYGDEPDAGKPAAGDEKEGISYTIPAGCADDLDINGLDYDYTYTRYGDAGTYGAKAKGIKSNNYNITITQGELVVEKRPVTFTWKDENGETEFSYTYDGENHSVSATPVTVNGDTIGELTYEKNIGKSAAEYTARVTAIPATGKAANYTLSADEPTASQTWNILQADNEWKDEDKPVTIDNWTYGTAPNTPEAESKFGQAKIYYRPADSEDENDWTETVPTRAGEYSLKAVVEETDDYKGLEATILFKIVPAKITVTAANKTSEYLADLQELTYTVEGRDGDSVKEGDNLNVTIHCYDKTEDDEEVKAITPKSHVGEYEIVATATDGEALNNYDIEHVTGTYTITKANADFEAEGWTGNYDGKGHGISVNVNTADGAEKAGVYYSLKDFKTILTADELAELESDVTGEKAKAVIEKLEANSDVAKESQKLSDVNDSAPVYYMIVSDNYHVVTGSKEVTINPRPITFEWPNKDGSEFIWEEDQWEYDGKFHTIEAKIANAVGDDASKITLNYTNPEDPSDVTNRKQHVGVYTAKVFSLSGDMAHNYTIAEGVSNNTHKWKIAKAELLITANDHEITYGDAPANNGVTYAGFVDGEDESVLDPAVGYDIEYKQFDDINENGFAINPVEADAHDYKITFKPGKLTVKKREITKDMLTVDTEFKYDGSKKTPKYELKFTAKDEMGEDVEYTLKEGKDFEVSGDTDGKTLGIYNIKFTGKGNFDGEISEDWRISNEKESEEFDEGNGKIIIEEDIYNDDVSVKVSGFDKDFAVSLLTEEELERVRESGETAKIFLEISEVDALEAADDEPTQALLKDMGYTACAYLDIKVYKKIGDDPASEVHNTGSRELSFTAGVPDEFINPETGYTRQFILVRAHEGDAVVLAGPTDGTILAFATSKFSGYTLAYKDTEIPVDDSDSGSGASTGDANHLIPWGIALTGALAAAFVLVRRRKNDSEA